MLNRANERASRNESAGPHDGGERDE
jgi:hypothetical protein